MKILIGIVSILFSLPVLAQNDSSKIVVHKDARIDQLIKKQIEINEITTRDARRHAQGFRILVINTNDRNKAMNAKAKIYQEFPELKAYLMWQQPFYKLKVGDFKDRKEAEEYLTSLQRIFTSGVYIVRDVIEVNPDKSGEL